jgi:hypothetical protein
MRRLLLCLDSRRLKGDVWQGRVKGETYRRLCHMTRIHALEGLLRIGFCLAFGRLSTTTIAWLVVRDSSIQL